METQKKKEKKNCDMTMMWLNWSVITINAMFEFIYIYIYIYRERERERERERD